MFSIDRCQPYQGRGKKQLSQLTCLLAHRPRFGKLQIPIFGSEGVTYEPVNEQ